MCRCQSVFRYNGLSKITMPHLLQMISPDLGSVIIASSLLHKGQTIEVSRTEFTLSSFRLFMNILFEESITMLFTNTCVV
jgi:hypothetical protein